MCVCAHSIIYPLLLFNYFLLYLKFIICLCIRNTYIPPILFGCMWLCVSHEMCHDMHHISLCSWFNPSYTVSHVPLCIKYIYIYNIYICINNFIYNICISHPHFKEGFLFVNPLSTVNYDKRMLDVSIRIKYPIIQYFLCISHCIATV